MTTLSLSRRLAAAVLLTVCLRGQAEDMPAPSPPSTTNKVAAPVAVLAEPGTKPAPNQAEAQAAKVVALQVTPAADKVTVQPLSLYPRFPELVEANAVPFYYRALLLWQQTGINATKTDGKTDQDRIAEWAELPIAEIPAEAAEKISVHGKVFAALQEATRRDRAEWDFRERHLTDLAVIGFLLPEMQELRMMARLLNLRAKLAIRDGRFADAAADLRMMFRMAHDIGECPFLICSLVGIAVHAIACDTAREFLAAPDAPSLYWPLVMVPDPVVNLRRAVEMESNFPAQIFPWLTEVRSTKYSAAEWDRRLTEAMKSLRSFHGLSASDASKVTWADSLGYAAFQVAEYPRARQWLLSQGMTEAELAKLPPGQVIAIRQAELVGQAYQELFRWMVVPYPIGRQKLDDLGKRWREPERRDPMHMVELLLPAMASIKRAEVRHCRRQRLLVAFEALRLYRHDHPNTWPATWDETGLFVPDDPMSGKPFPLAVAGDAAVIDLTGAADHAADPLAKRYEIRQR